MCARAQLLDLLKQDTYELEDKPRLVKLVNCESSLGMLPPSSFSHSWSVDSKVNRESSGGIVPNEKHEYNEPNEIQTKANEQDAALKTRPMTYH